MAFTSPPKDRYTAVESDFGAAVGADLRRLTGIFWKGAPLILACGALATLLAVAFVWLTPPLYNARAELLIDPRQKRTIENEVSPTGLGSSAVGADTLLLDSQIAVMKSQAVIARLIEEEGLTRDPEFAGVDRSSLVARLKNLAKSVVYGPQSRHWNALSDFDRANTNLREKLSVERQRNTYVIAISMLSQDPEKAARLANRVAEIYIAQSNLTAANSTTEAAESLYSRLEELSVNARDAARRVEDYRRDNGLIGVQNVLVVEQQLRNLNEQLSVSRGRENEALATLNQAQAAGAFGVADTGTGDALQSQVMTELQTGFAAVEATEAELAASLLPNHPRLIELQQRKNALRQSIDNEYNRILARLRVDYETASENTRSLVAEVNALQQRLAESNESSVELQELQRQADASQNVYQSFLTRSKEAAEQIGIPNSTATIISEAYTATRPAYPVVKLILPAAALFGLMLGVVIVWLRHILGAAKAPKPMRRSLNEPLMAQPFRSDPAAPEPSLLNRIHRARS